MSPCPFPSTITITPQAPPPPKKRFMVDFIIEFVTDFKFLLVVISKISKKGEMLVFSSLVKSTVGSILLSISAMFVRLLFYGYISNISSIL